MISVRGFLPLCSFRIVRRMSQNIDQKRLERIFERLSDSDPEIRASQASNLRWESWDSRGEPEMEVFGGNVSLPLARTSQPTFGLLRF